MTRPQPIRHPAGLLFLLAALAPPLAGLAAAAQQPYGAVVVEWAPDGKVLIASKGLLARFDLDSAQEELLDDSGVTFALSPPDALGGTRLAVGGTNRLEVRGYPDLEVRAVLALPPPESGEPESGPPTAIDALAWSPDGSTLAAGTRSGHILLWEVEPRSPESGEPDLGELWADLGVEPPSAVTRLRFSADGTRLLTAFDDGRAVLWDLERRQMLHRLEWARNARGEGKEATAVTALSPDGRHVLANRLGAEDAEMALLDAEGREQWRRAGYGVEFTHDGTALLALAPPFRIAVLYRTADAEALRVFEPPEGVELLYVVRLSPDGARLLGVGEASHGQVLVVWDFATAQVLKTRR